MAISTKSERTHPFYLARKARGLSLREVHEMTGVDFGWVARIERGEAAGSIAMLRRLAEALGLEEDAARFRRYDPDAR